MKDFININIPLLIHLLFSNNKIIKNLFKFVIFYTGTDINLIKILILPFRIMSFLCGSLIKSQNSTVASQGFVHSYSTNLKQNNLSKNPYSSNSQQIYPKDPSIEANTSKFSLRNYHQEIKEQVHHIQSLNSSSVYSYHHPLSHKMSEMPKTKLLTNFLSSYEKHEQAKEAKSRISLFLHKKDVLDKKNNSKVRHSLSKDRHRQKSQEKVPRGKEFINKNALFESIVSEQCIQNTRKVGKIIDKKWGQLYKSQIVFQRQNTFGGQIKEVKTEKQVGKFSLRYNK